MAQIAADSHNLRLRHVCEEAHGPVDVALRGKGGDKGAPLQRALCCPLHIPSCSHVSGVASKRLKVAVALGRGLDPGRAGAGATTASHITKARDSLASSNDVEAVDIGVLLEDGTLAGENLDPGTGKQGVVELGTAGPQQRGGLQVAHVYKGDDLVADRQRQALQGGSLPVGADVLHHVELVLELLLKVHDVVALGKLPQVLLPLPLLQVGAVVETESGGDGAHDICRDSQICEDEESCVDDGREADWRDVPEAHRGKGDYGPVKGEEVPGIDLGLVHVKRVEEDAALRGGVKLANDGEDARTPVYPEEHNSEVAADNCEALHALPPGEVEDTGKLPDAVQAGEGEEVKEVQVASSGQGLGV
mmetsp:Transcript_6133/g.17115  ORF Transcript_6133/g.17115 Transcript_6133/m.17115 type:complete len:362 (+) Transcript_6133:1774-2859(+)